MKLQAPKIPNKSGLTASTVKQLIAETTIESIWLHDVDASGLIAKSLGIDEAVLEKVVLAGAKLERFSITDAELRGCDLSAAQCPHASILRTHIKGGRLTGIDLSRSMIRDVVFEGCKLDMANFRYATLERVSFVDCMLTETDFQAAELSIVSFATSTLDRVEFGHCRLKDCDVRTSQLLAVRGWQYLKGLSVDSTQLIAIAPQLALELGIIIKDS